MEINHENAMKLWKERFGKGVNEAKDRKGRIMLKTAFGWWLGIWLEYSS